MSGRVRSQAPRRAAARRKSVPPPAAPAALPRPSPDRLLEGVLALGKELHLDMDEAALADRILRTLADLFPGRLIAIRVEHPGGDRLVAAAPGVTLRPGAERDPFRVKRSSVEKTQLDRAVLTAGRVQVVPAPEPVIAGAEVGFSIPLVAGGEIYGALDVGYPPNAEVPGDDEPTMIPIANQLSVALRNQRLHGEASLLRNYLGKLIDHANALIVGVDPHWRITVFNQALARLTGRAPRDVIGSDLRDWLPPTERSRLLPLILEALAGRSGGTVDVELAGPDGRSVRTIWTVAAVGARGRRVEAVVAVGQDVTRIRSLERQVIQAEKLATLGQLAAGVVHELNNPLTSITVYADYLLKKAERRDAFGAADAEKLRRILEGAERILNFSRDLVQYAKPAPEKLDVVSLNDVVRQSLSFCEHMVRKAKARLDADLASELPPLYAVRGQLQQVVINLVTNALHALGAKGGHVQLRTFARAPDHVGLSVEDDGVGIRPEDRDRIFEPFFTTKTDGQGTGLGLSIVQNIIERHRGTIEVRSAPGEGASFTVLLPTRHWARK